MDVTSTVPKILCIMFASSSSTHGIEFPALEGKTNPTTQAHTKSFIQPTEVQPNGRLKLLTQAKEVLNWQTENSLAQNGLLIKINQKIDSIMPAIE